MEEIKGQVRFNTKLLQNILAKVEVAATVPETDQTLDIGIDFPMKTLNNLDALEEQLEDSDVVKALVCQLYFEFMGFFYKYKRFIVHICLHFIFIFVKYLDTLH